MKNADQYVVVTTDNTRRGVFGGLLKSYDKQNAYAVLEEARMAVYWSSDCRGVMGLAAIGPQNGSRISPAVPQLEINGVTSVMVCTDQAKKEWESGKWA